MQEAPAAITVLWQAWSHPVQGKRLMRRKGRPSSRNLGRGCRNCSCLGTRQKPSQQRPTRRASSSFSSSFTLSLSHKVWIGWLVCFFLSFLLEYECNVNQLVVVLPAAPRNVYYLPC